MVLIFKLCDVCGSAHKHSCKRQSSVCKQPVCVFVLHFDLGAMCAHGCRHTYMCKSHLGVCIVYVGVFFFLFFFFCKTIKTLICPEIISDVNVEWCPLEPSNEACGISPAPNLTS